MLSSAYYSDLYRANFSLGKSFFDHINHDTLDLVSRKDLIVGIR